jgi:hypothetical protein
MMSGISHRRNTMHYLFFLLPFCILLLCTSNSTWSPFQSDQVKEICSHMTAEERRRAVGRGAVCGLILGGVLGVTGFVGMPIGKWLFDSFLIGVIIIQPLALLLMGISFWKLKPLIDQSQKDFLASTQWSKEQGLTSDKIVLRRS